jgi:DNA-binding LacI/PurR family transcriptional regulator
MSEETRARVQRAIDEAQYQPHRAAQSLRSGRTRTLGFLVLDEHARFLADPLTDLMLAGVGDVARDRGYSVLIHGDRPSVRAAELLRPVRERRVDAAFLMLSGELDIRRSYVDEVADLGVPFVIFDEPVTAPQGISITAMNRFGARRLTEHLLGRGHRRVGFIAARVPWPVVEERHAGYRDALQEATIRPDPELELFEGGFDETGGRAMTEKLLDLRKPPTAILATSDLLAAGALAAARDRDRQVPHQLAICGFDDFSFAKLLDPPLTTVHVPGYEMGQTAAELLVDQLEGRSNGDRNIVLPVSLCYRGSA